MKFKIVYLFVFLFIYNCSGFEFVYENNIEKNTLKNKTSFIIVGDDATLAKIEIKSLVGETNKNKQEYILYINSKKTLKNLIVESNQVATQIEISHDLTYRLESVKKSCDIDTTKIRSTSEYNVKSSGYDFGSDAAKNEIIKQNIIKNIKQYLQFLSENLENFKC